ncbi:MAG: pilus assembly PilX N-terminal domain-containing protein [Thermoanaerobaculia bacterium]|nr:pilus assembly PilX N-terminal domain-containing protein [Thermoanaerobaculia bacterium]
MSNNGSHRRARRNTESGSAYIIALLLLVVFTVIGLGLTLITQTEMQLGANEKTLQRSFYAADSGLSLKQAEALTEADFASKTYTLQDLGMASPGLATQEVDTSPFFPIEKSPCNLCDINNQGEYRENSFWRLNYAATAEASRYVGSSAEATSMKTIATMVSVQPWRDSAEAYVPMTQPDELKKIKF